jgi:hypothetical protein
LPPRKGPLSAGPLLPHFIREKRYDSILLHVVLKHYSLDFAEADGAFLKAVEDQGCTVTGLGEMRFGCWREQRGAVRGRGHAAVIRITAKTPNRPRSNNAALSIRNSCVRGSTRRHTNAQMAAIKPTRKMNDRTSLNISLLYSILPRASSTKWPILTCVGNLACRHRPRASKSLWWVIDSQAEKIHGRQSLVPESPAGRGYGLTNRRCGFQY